MNIAPVAAMVTEAEKEIEILTPEQVAEEIKNENVLLFDMFLPGTIFTYRFINVIVPFNKSVDKSFQIALA